MEQKDYYEILEIGIEAPPKKIKEAYRSLAFQCHPDRNGGGADALERMKTINEAYAVLSDPAKRKQYDSLRQTYGSGMVILKKIYSGDRILTRYLKRSRNHSGSGVSRMFSENPMGPVTAPSNSGEGASLDGVLYGLAA
jgi:curved DNA-binding protein CbpA